MSILNPHPKEDLIRFLDGALEESEKLTVQQHLTTCQECQSYLSFVKDFHHGLAGLGEEEFTSQEPCPDSWTLVSYEADDVDEETARNMRVHLLFCDKCQEEFYMLRRQRIAEGKEAKIEFWQELIEKLKGFAIDLAKTYGPGTLLGSARIAAEGPALAMRGGEVSERIFKVVEISLGENIYGIELAVTPEGLVSCDIAGYTTPHLTPMKIVAYSEAGQELLETETDTYGNASFVLAKEQASQDLCVLGFTLDSQEDYLLFLLPPPVSPP